MTPLERARVRCPRGFATVLATVLIVAAPLATANGAGMWISPAEIQTLPTSGRAWDHVQDYASRSSTPRLSDQEDAANVQVMAKALVCARTGDRCAEARRGVMDAIGTDGGRTLALGRELAAYVIAADLIGLDGADDERFKSWLGTVRHRRLEGRTLITTHEDRPNNWGTHAGASRIAVAIYLGDHQDLDRAAQVFKGFLGDRDTYSGFEYRSLSWQANPSRPVGINPKGSTKNGHNIDGILPDDQRRAGNFRWPPPRENYVWEGLQGVLVQALLLHRAGYDVWNWEDKAILRAIEWLHDEGDYPAEGDDTWQPHIINFYYGTNFPAPSPSRPGKNVGFTDWTHQRGYYDPGSTPLTAPAAPRLLPQS